MERKRTAAGRLSAAWAEIDLSWWKMRNVLDGKKCAMAGPCGVAWRCDVAWHGQGQVACHVGGGGMCSGGGRGKAGITPSGSVGGGLGAGGRCRRF